MTKEEAITKIKRKACFGGYNNKHLCQWADEGYGKCEECENYMAIKALEQGPKTGRWILEQVEGDFIWWKCSECGQVIYSKTEKDRREFHAFCSRCGAKMQ